MNIIARERLVMCDIDDTLVMHRSLPKPYSWKDDGNCILVRDRHTGENFILEINKNMVRLLKEEHNRGATVIVWSRGGYQWAADVITALDLQGFVHTVMSKPLVYFDDKPVTEWLTDRVYIGPDANYKSNTYKA